MKLRDLLVLMSGLIALSGSSLNAQPDHPPKLPTVWKHDFTKKPTGEDFQIIGVSRWKPGQIHLMEKSGLVKGIPVGSSVRMTANLQFPQAVTSSNVCEVRLYFQMNDSSRVREEKLILVIRMEKAPRLTTGKVVFCLQKSANGPLEILKSISLNNAMPSGLWSFVYRAGLLEVWQGDQVLGRTFYPIPDRIPVGLFAVHQFQGDSILRSISLQGVPRENSLSDQQKRHKEKAEALTAKLTASLNQKGRKEIQQLAEESLRLWQQAYGENSARFVGILKQTAIVLEKSSNANLAHPHYQRLVKLRKNTLGSYHPYYANSLLRLATVERQMHQYASAIRNCTTACAVLKIVLGELSASYTQALSNLAVCYEKAGNYRRMEAILKQKLSLQQKLTQQFPDLYEGYVTTLNELGGLYLARAAASQSRKYYQIALNFLRQNGKKRTLSYATTKSNHAALLQSIGEHELCVEQSLEAAKLFEELNGPEQDISRCYQNVFGAYLALGAQKGERSMVLLAKALSDNTLSKFPDVKKRQATIRSNLAYAEMLLGNFQEALKLCNQAIALAKAGGNRLDLAQCLSHRGICYYASRRYDKAEEDFNQALKMFESTIERENVLFAQSLDRKGQVLVAQDRHREAAHCFKEAYHIRLRLARQLIPGLAPGAAMSYLEMTAPFPFLYLQHLEHSLKNGASPEKQDRVAYEILWESKGLASRLQSGRKPGRNDPPEIHQLHRQLHKMENQLSQVVMTNPGTEETRMEKLERIQSLTLKKELLIRTLTEKSPTYRLSGQAGRNLKVQQLLNALPETMVVIDFLETVHLSKDSQKDSMAGMERRYEAFVLRKPGRGFSGVKRIPLGPATIIDETILRWRKKLAKATRKEEEHLRREGQQLRKLLWNPIEKHLGGASNVVIIPDRFLSYLPWAALPGKNSKTYLIEDYALSFSPYGQHLCWTLQNQKSPDPEKVLVMGGVDYSGGRLIINVQKGGTEPGNGKGPEIFNSLPGTQKDVDLIRRVLSSSHNVTVLSGREGTENRLKQALPGKSHVHIGSHVVSLAGRSGASDWSHRDINLTLRKGFVSTQTSNSVLYRIPLSSSAIVCAGVNQKQALVQKGINVEEDGFLSAEEIAHLSLEDSSLVVLSACNSSTGPVRPGEGIFGLRRAFLDAGSARVIAAQWAVEDSDANQLMCELYHRTLRKRNDPGKALRQAQLALLDQARNGKTERFYTWAAFSLEGTPSVDAPVLYQPLEEKRSPLPVKTEWSLNNVLMICSTILGVISLFFLFFWRMKRRNRNCD